MPTSKRRRQAPAEPVLSFEEEMAKRVAARIRERARTDPEVRALVEKLVDQLPYIRLGDLR